MTDEDVLRGKNRLRCQVCSYVVVLCMPTLNHCVGAHESGAKVSALRGYCPSGSDAYLEGLDSKLTCVYSGGFVR